MTDLKSPIAFTANRLADGEVVWLCEDGSWTEKVSRAGVARTVAERDGFLAAATRADEDNIVVEPYEIDVRVVAGNVTPTKFREIIRATGPTVRRDLGKQAAAPSRKAA